MAQLVKAKKAENIPVLRGRLVYMGLLVTLQGGAAAYSVYTAPSSTQFDFLTTGSFQYARSFLGSLKEKLTRTIG